MMQDVNYGPAAVAEVDEYADLFHELDQEAVAVPENVTAAEFTRRLHAEMAGYCAEQVLNRLNNPLHWWKEKQYFYPLLAALARRILCNYSCFFCSLRTTIQSRRTDDCQ